MKNIFIRISAFLAAAVVLFSCGSDNKKGKDAVDISGEWKLESVGGVSASELAKDKIGGLDVYISFSDGSFETFQRLVDGKIYVRYDGTYTVDGASASGAYSDGTLWGASYTVKVEGGETLVMSAAGEDCVYKKTGIPADVRSQAFNGVDLKSVADTELPGKFL